MATYESFEELQSWQKARRLVREIYAFSKNSAFGRDLGLRDQIRRAAVSVMSNVAEGFERGGTGEFVQFLSLAKGIGRIGRCYSNRRWGHQYDAILAW